jgi:hypothetical protein
MSGTNGLVKTSKGHLQDLLAEIEKGEAGVPEVFERIDEIARLSESEYPRLEAILKERLDGLNLNQLRSARNEARKQVQTKQFKNKELPQILLNERPSRMVVDEGLGALRQYNQPPRLFTQGDRIVHVTGNDQKEVGKDLFADHISRAADFFRMTQAGPRYADPPMRLVRRMRQKAKEKLPELRGIIEVPVLKEDGSVASEPGYDEQTQLIYAPEDGFEPPQVPPEPTDEEVRQAVEMLEEPLVDFPFDDQASRANAFALMLTPVIRPVIGDACVPLACIDAPEQGTGKTLLADAISIITMGRPAPTMSVPGTESEWRKQITAQLRAGSRFIVIDNVHGRLRSSSLERLLTTSTWSDRLLGASEQLTLPNRSAWVATGNNLTPHGELTRRCYVIRLDAEKPQPWRGREFKHPNLRQWISERRGVLVEALLVLARNWFSCGCPDPEIDELGSFEEWTRTVGGILEAAGMPGFLENLGELYDTADRSGAEWASFLRALHVWTSDRADSRFTAKELAQEIEDQYKTDDGQNRPPSIREVIESLPPKVGERLRQGKSISRSLGNLFRSRRGRRFGPEEWHVVSAGKRSRRMLWEVRGGDLE